MLKEQIDLISADIKMVRKLRKNLKRYAHLKTPYKNLLKRIGKDNCWVLDETLGVWKYAQNEYGNFQEKKIYRISEDLLVGIIEKEKNREVS
jgi:hypothetical protein